MPIHSDRLRRTLFVAVSLGFSGARAADTLVFFGTYTDGKSQGIYRSHLNPQTGALSAPELAAQTRNPSFVALHPSGKFLYAVGELSEVNGTPGGAVSAFKVDQQTGQLTALNQESSKGAGPCHLTVDARGRWVLLANYVGGSVSVLPIKEDGSLGPATAFIQHQGSSVDPQRQREPHAHSINLDAANRFAVVADLGLDKLMVYQLDPEKGALTPNDPPFASVKAGSGPRHFAFHPDGRHAFVINEMVSTLTAFRYDGRRGQLEEIQTISTLPEGVASERNSTAEVQVHPSGQFVYGSNRGHNSIAVFRFDGRTERLTLVEHEPTQGKIPRNFKIDPSGRWLLAANQDSDSVVVFQIDPGTGALSAIGQQIEVGKPVCVRFLARP